MELDEIAQNRLEAQEIGEIECSISVERQIAEPSKLLREYRYRFNQKRRELIQDTLTELIDLIDPNLRILSKLLETEDESNHVVIHEQFDELKKNVSQIDSLLGSSVSKLPHWSDLHRHMHFNMRCDLEDIIKNNWPSAKAGLRKSMYGEREPVPIEV
jgi:hypothetical protein